MKIFCQDCAHKDPSNSFIGLSLGNLTDPENQIFLIHFFEWQFNNIWSRDFDEDEDLCEGCSLVRSLTVPD